MFPSLNVAAAAQNTALFTSPWAMILNGLLAFVSPCIIPMLPIYAAYLLGNTSTDNQKKGINMQSLIKLLGLMLGFIAVFVILGALAGLAGSLNSKIDRNLIDIISNVLLILFGFMMLGIIPGLQFNVSGDANKMVAGGFFQNMLFGAVLVMSWTPCITPLLGNALLAAASAESATAFKGMYMLGFFALGLSIPMVIIMLLYQRLSGLLNFLKKHNIIIRKVAGIIMILLGVLKFFIKF